ncbi:A disintegrin and metalloproteinase with thrombospondin motifs 14-like isoform X4 [Mercenaria mercenaria]|uniref:A disintegrin and metalloproteinase with thrombospondin motifs 14-like isoform X4 n=1 Tax=Mercenaria mercenaria TaxID=6596 RepID=UPI00234EDCB3|nr:A disintegrin and metalloproteinase with thrombospondin motifs 14-like isoform X4 [Mercenaria mercenaria]
MATTVRYTKSSGVVTPTIKLNELEANEGDYAVITRGGDMEETYQNVKTERKANRNNVEISKEKLDKTKLLKVLLCCVVSGLVVAVVLSNLVIFSILQKAVTDGGWTGWADWGVCSVTCGGGFTTRMLQCANPRPSITGRFCDGTSLQVQSCNNTACSGSSAAVFVYNTTDDSGHPLHFQNAFFNSDNAFNMISSIFECKQEGVYFFVNTISRKKGCSGSTYCSFYINDERSSFAGYADSIDDDSYPSGTEAVLHYLKPGDRVYIGGCRNASCIDSSSSFTGFIINAVY